MRACPGRFVSHGTGAGRQSHPSRSRFWAVYFQEGLSVRCCGGLGQGLPVQQGRVTRARRWSRLRRRGWHAGRQSQAAGLREGNFRPVSAERRPGAGQSAGRVCKPWRNT